MTVCTSDYELYNSLKHNFLYNNDINCIHILLNLYDLEENIRNIFPKYISIRHLRNHISKCLKERSGNELIAKNLGELIHEDINRLELSLYLEGYKQGYYCKKRVNLLESLTIKFFSIDELYSLKYLFHFETKRKEVLDLKERIFSEIDEDEKHTKFLYNNINKYISNIIKTKVHSLNKHLDKQLTIDCCSDAGKIKEESSLLTKEDLHIIYKEVKRIIIKNGFKLYKDAYWNGLNDRVLKRYR